PAGPSTSRILQCSGSSIRTGPTAISTDCTGPCPVLVDVSAGVAGKSDRSAMAAPSGVCAERSGAAARPDTVTHSTKPITSAAATATTTVTVGEATDRPGAGATRAPCNHGRTRSSGGSGEAVPASAAGRTTAGDPSVEGNRAPQASG